MVRVDGCARRWQRTEDEDRCYDVCMRDETGLEESLRTVGQAGIARTLGCVEDRMLGLEMELALARDLAGRIA